MSHCMSYCTCPYVSFKKRAVAGLDVGKRRGDVDVPLIGGPSGTAYPSDSCAGGSFRGSGASRKIVSGVPGEFIRFSPDGQLPHTPSLVRTPASSERCSGGSVAVSSKKRCTCPPTPRPCRSACEIDNSSGKARKRTLSGGRVWSGSGCGNNEAGVHRGFQRRRIRRRRAPTAGRPCPGGTHSMRPPRIPWIDHSGTQDESTGGSDDLFVEFGSWERHAEEYLLHHLGSSPQFARGHRDGRRTRPGRMRRLRTPVCDAVSDLRDARGCNERQTWGWPVLGLSVPDARPDARLSPFEASRGEPSASESQWSETASKDAAFLLNFVLDFVVGVCTCVILWVRSRRTDPIVVRGFWFSREPLRV